MNFEQLEILEAAFMHGSFGAASKALGKSQPAISVAIKTLEDELGFQIFDRSGYRPRPTEQGKVFFESALEVLCAMKTARRIGKELGEQKKETSVTITIDPLVRFSIFSSIIENCFQSDSYTTLIVQNAVSEGALEDLNHGYADLAIGHALNPGENIEALPFCEVSLVPLVLKQIYSRYETEEELIRNLPQIVVFNRNASGSDEKNLPPPITADARTIYVSDHSMKARMIHEGLGWGRLRMHEIVQDKLTALSSDVYPPINLNLCIMRNAHRPLGPIGRKIWESFRSQSHVNIPSQLLM